MRNKPLETAAWGIALFAGCRVIEIVLEAQSLAALVGQAVLVEWATARLGVYWTEPETTPHLPKRIGLGALVGVVGALLVFGVLAASRQLVYERVPQIEPSVILIGLATAALGAWRDELLFHGVLLRMLEGRPALLRVLACGITSAGAALGRRDADARIVVVAGLAGLVFGALWVRDKGAWQPFAASTALRYVTGTLLAGGLVHCRLADNSFAGGTQGLLGGTAAVLALAPLAVTAVVYTARTGGDRIGSQ